MLTYIYDSSFDGYLCALEIIFSNQNIPEDIISESAFLNNLFSDTIKIQTDYSLSEAFLKKIGTKYSLEVLRDLMLVFITSDPGVEMVLFEYLKYIQKHGIRSIQNYSNSTIRKVRKLCQKVTFEIHRLKGLLRFHKLKDGTFYGPLEPDYPIIQMLAPHFRKRFGNQKWMIHDTKRNTAIFCDGKKWESVELEEEDAAVFKAIMNNDPSYVDLEEKFYQSLWKTYFNAIAIQERKNPRLQKQFMPKRYWKYLIEKQG